jgi:hypothetical protein
VGVEAVGAASPVTGAEARRARAALAFVVGWGLVAPVAASAAAAPTEDELRAARQLFTDAEHDEDGGRWSEALEKLRRVEQVKHTAGVRSHVALCEEHLGQLVRALDDYAAAETEARASGASEVVRFVQKRVTDLGPRVPRLTVMLEPAGADAVVTLDGTALSPSQLDVRLPVDPGEHVLEATARGRSPVRRSFSMQEGYVTVVEMDTREPTPAPSAATVVPPPAPAATLAPIPVPEPPPRTAPETQAPSRTAAWLSTGGAVALAGAGFAAYLLAGSARTSAIEQCARIVSNSPDACAGPRNGVRAWDATAAIAWLGAAGAGALAVVLWTRPAAPPASARVVIVPGGLVVGGRF